MKSQVKEKWIAALRSGEYSQGDGRLRSYKGFCCLGVLCDLYSQEQDTNWEFRGVDECDMQMLDYWYFDGESEFLPQSVMEWAGLSLPSPTVKMNVEEEDEMSWSYRDEISNLNDSGCSFTELANIIEKQL
jgi:hypothetical protein